MLSQFKRNDNKVAVQAVLQEQLHRQLQVQIRSTWQVALYAKRWSTSQLCEDMLVNTSWTILSQGKMYVDFVGEKGVKTSWQGLLEKEQKISSRFKAIVTMLLNGRRLHSSQHETLAPIIWSCAASVRDLFGHTMQFIIILIDILTLKNLTWYRKMKSRRWNQQENNFPSSPYRSLDSHWLDWLCSITMTYLVMFTPIVTLLFCSFVCLFLDKKSSTHNCWSWLCVFVPLFAK